MAALAPVSGREGIVPSSSLPPARQDLNLGPITSTTDPEGNDYKIMNFVHPTTKHPQQLVLNQKTKQAFILPQITILSDSAGKAITAIPSGKPIVELKQDIEGVDERQAMENAIWKLIGKEKEIDQKVLMDESKEAENPEGDTNQPPPLKKRCCENLSNQVKTVGNNSLQYFRTHKMELALVTLAVIVSYVATKHFLLPPVLDLKQPVQPRFTNTDINTVNTATNTGSSARKIILPGGTEIYLNN